MESFINDVNNKLLQRNVSTNISNCNNSLRPEQFYNKNREGSLISRLYTEVQPPHKYADNRPVFQSSRFKPINSSFQIVPSSQGLLSDVSLFNIDRNRTNENQYNKVMSPVGETSAMNIQTRNNCNDYSINNGHQFRRRNDVDDPQLRSVNGVDDQFRRHNGGDDQSRRPNGGYDQARRPNGGDDQFKRPNDGDHQFRRPNDGDHQFRRPYDVRIPNSSIMDRRGDMSVASSFFPTSTTSVQQIKAELSTAMSMIELVSSTGIPLEKMDKCIQIFLFTLKKKVQSLMYKSVPSNMSTVSTNMLTAEKAQSIQQWINSTVVSAPPLLPPLPSTCSEFTSVSMQQTAGFAGFRTNTLENQVQAMNSFFNLRQQNELNKAEQQAVQLPEKLQGNKVSVERNAPDCNRRKSSLDDSLPLNCILRERKQNTSKQLEKQPVIKKVQSSRQKESPPVSSPKLKPVRGKATKSQEETNKNIEKSKQVQTPKDKQIQEPSGVQNKNETSQQRRGRSASRASLTNVKQIAADKPESVNSSKILKAKPTRKSNDKENQPVKHNKAATKVPAKEKKKTPEQTRSRKVDPLETICNQERKELRNRLDETIRVTSRGRVVKQNCKFWEVGRQPLEKVTDTLEIDEPVKQKKNIPTVPGKRVRKPISAKEDKQIQEPSADQNKNQTSQQRRSTPAPPNKVKPATTNKAESPNSSKITKVRPAPRKRNKKEKEPVKNTKAAKKVTAKESEKPTPSKGKKRTGTLDECESANKKKRLDDNPILDDSFHYCGPPGTSNCFRFEVPSPGEALNSIRKKTIPDSGRETPPTRYLCSFLDHTGRTVSPSVVSEDERKTAVKSHAADRIAKKMTKAKGINKPRKRKVVNAKTDTDPAAKELLTQVLHSKGKLPTKLEQVFGKKTKNVNLDDSCDYWENESDVDSCGDLN